MTTLQKLGALFMVLLTAFAGLAWALHKDRQEHWQAGYTARVNDEARAAQEAKKINEKREAEQRATNAQIAQKNEQRKTHDQSIIVDLRVELERLRNTPSPGADLPAPGTATGRLDGEDTWAKLGQCAGQLEAMAETASACDRRLSGLQVWAGGAIKLCGR